MADTPLSDLSDEALFVRIRGRIYVIPTTELEDFRRSKFEKVKGDQIEQIFARARGDCEAALINLVVVADADIGPPPVYEARGARKGTKGARGGAKAGAKGGAPRRPRGTKG
ncbi:hypothetical protein [Microvirga thermotolerans]|uniref:Uncharacterized protein n=1 Tax=Microvirga thermotolerans TaxID=2651334 RepID=A0A5P9K2G7_9HYPH|nr:hypothetical protein [Microvirga thermotolerans]QFU17890.1 hypothetical protein GDR74_17655 [Microvirga thermotolerans]